VPFILDTRRSRWRAILQLAWPLIIANSFWNLQLTIDRVFLGQYSTEALGAAMAVMGVFWTPMALLQQTSAYLTTFVAQYFGAKEYSRIGPAVWQAIYISVIGGVVFLGLIPLSAPFFATVGHPATVQVLEATYFDALTYSALPTAIVAATGGFFTGLGNTRAIMWINCVGMIANAALDYIMIFGHFGCPELGIAGAGYATTIGTWLAACYGLYLVFSKSHGREYGLFSGWRYDAALMRRYLKYGIPSGLQWALEGLAFTVFLIIIGRMADGTAGLAASSIAVTVMMLAILPALGIAQAVSVLVGQHLGEQRPELAEAAAWSGFQVAEMYIVTIGVTFILFPQFYLGWFHNADNVALWQEVSVMVPYLLMFVALFISFDAMNMVFSFALKGAGDTRFVSLAALTVPWPVMVIPTYLMKDWHGAIYWAWAAASAFGITQALIFFRRFLGGKWQKMSVIH
jgi:multidrug resistance protein, MATE family